MSSHPFYRTAWRASLEEDARQLVQDSIAAGRKIMSAVGMGWPPDAPPTERAFLIGNRVCELLHLATAEGVDPWCLLEEAADRFFFEERDAGTAKHESTFRQPKAESGGGA